MIPEMFLNHGTEFDLLGGEFAAYPTLLRRAVTTNNKRLYRALLRDLLTLLDDLEVCDEERRQR